MPRAFSGKAGPIRNNLQGSRTTAKLPARVTWAISIVYSWLVIRLVPEEFTCFHGSILATNAITGA